MASVQGTGRHKPRMKVITKPFDFRRFLCSPIGKDRLLSGRDADGFVVVGSGDGQVEDDRVMV